MGRIPQTPPTILPLITQHNRPLWSVMIPVYNCAGFVRETLMSVLAQDLGADQMQIEVVDDASTDADVAALVEQLGKGRVSYFRQPTNVGSLRNFETCINRSRGQLVHLLHGDDRVMLGFYAKFTELFERFPQAGAAFCNYYAINSRGEKLGSYTPEMHQDGILQDWLCRIATYQRKQYVCTVVKRAVYEKLGAFCKVTYGEDWEMWVRIARHYPVAYTPEPLAEYRGHTDSISSQKSRAGEMLQDLNVVMNEIKKHLPEERKQRISNESIEYYTQFQVYAIFDEWKIIGNHKTLIAKIRKTLRIHSSLSIYRLITELFIKKSLQRVWMTLNSNQKLVKNQSIHQ